MKVVLLCAGKWTRMLPWTKVFPKEMLPLWSKPLLHHTVSNFFQTWFRDFIFVLWSWKDCIIDYFTHCDDDHDEIKKLNHIIDDSKIAFVRDTYKWTWWSLLSTQQNISDDYFFLVFGDICISSDHIEKMISLHDYNHQVALITSVDSTYKTRYKQTILWKDNIISDILAIPDLDDKDMDIVWWVFILHRDIFDFIKDIVDIENKEKEFGLIRPLQNMISKHDILWYRWSVYDIWNINERKKAFMDFD